MLRYLLATLLTLTFAVGFAQDNGQEKLSASMKLFLAEGGIDKRFVFSAGNQNYVSVFLELNDTSGNIALSKSGVRFRTFAKNIATADIPLQDITRIAALPIVKRIELPLLFQKTDTLVKKMVTADKVLSGSSPLSRSYTGKNVLIGIIDDGIDVMHPDFQDSNGRTMVKALWNMEAYGFTPPAGYSYGRLWTPDSINHYINLHEARNFSPYELYKLFGYCYHGSSVAGLAVGKNGVAPGATIVGVALTATAEAVLRSDKIIDGIAFIYQKAKEENKKCVINISLGVLDGAPHDGNSLVERAIDNFCSEKSDILVCVSAGNNGNSWKHWGGVPIHRDSSFSFFRCSYKASLYFTIPRQFSQTLNISIGESNLGSLNDPNISRDSVFYQTPSLNISDIIKSGTPKDFTSYLKNGSPSSTITFTAAHYNQDYDELIVTTDEHTSGVAGNPVFDPHLYRYIFKGSGIVHGWYPFLNLHPIFFFDRNPYPNDSTYVGTDNNYTTIIPTNAFTVLSSGAYNIRNCYVNAQNNLQFSYPSCQLTYFTSHGPTLDGRIKPDILTPGENVIAPRSANVNFFGYGDEIDLNYHFFSGTSASSPIAAGIAALIWERFPNFTRDSIISRIKSTARSDSFALTTGPLPNNIAGWGKADAFRALTGISSDLSQLCGQKLVCLPKPPPSPFINNEFVNINPNPASSYVNIQYNIPSHLQLSVFNSIGQLLKIEKLPPSNVVISRRLYIGYLPSGIYFIRISGGTQTLTKRILIQH